MNRRTHHRTLAVLLAVVVLAAALPAGSAEPFDPDKFLQNKALKAELDKVASEEAAQRSIMSHANQSFGITSTLFDFAAKLASGDYIEQVEKIMDVPVQKWNMNLGWSGGYDITTVKRIVNQNQTTSLFGRVKDDMGNLGTALSIYSIMNDVYAGYNGDGGARLKGMIGTYELVKNYWAQRVGWNSLGTAMMGAAVVGYALDTFVNTTMGTYNDNWYAQYSGYLDRKYPSMVTGPDSWAAVGKTGGEAAIQARLDEYWQTPYENLTRPSFTKVDYADLQLRKAFAARYYRDNLHTTLKTYYSNEAEKARDLAAYRAEKDYNHLMQLLAELEQLRLAIEDARDAETGDEEEAPVALLIRPAAKTLKVGDSVTFTTWYLYQDQSLKTATSRSAFSGAASSPTFQATEPGTFTVTATCGGLIDDAVVTVEEKKDEGDDDEEDEIEEVIDDIKDPEDEDACDPAGIAEMRATLAGLIGRVQSKSAMVTTYRTKFDKELADRAADPCGNSLMAYCYTQAQDAARELDLIVDDIRNQASSLIMTMALCPVEADASGEPFTIQDIIRDLADAGSARGDAESALAAMQSRLGENGCDEQEFTDRADQYVEDGRDPDELQDGGNMTEIGGDGVDNDQDGLQEEDWTEVAGKNVTIVVYDSGSAKDDVFNLSVGGVGNLGTTPAGGLRTYGLDLTPGTYIATISVVVAPDNVGTVTAVAVQNGVELSAVSGSPPQGGVVTMTFTVTGE